MNSESSSASYVPADCGGGGGGGAGGLLWLLVKPSNQRQLRRAEGEEGKSRELAPRGGKEQLN